MTAHKIGEGGVGAWVVVVVGMERNTSELCTSGEYF